LQGAQAQVASTLDQVLDPAIKTTMLMSSEPPYEMPLIWLGSEQQLQLTFDELMPYAQRQSDFTVDFVPCNADWEPVRILPLEFFEGYPQRLITDWTRSDPTQVMRPYTHYAFVFPEAGEAFKMSGNYLLRVYRDGDDDKTVLIRRFVVAENMVEVKQFSALSTLARQPMRTLDIEVSAGVLESPDPLSYIRTKVLQNYRWDNAIEVQPSYIADQRFRYHLELPEAFGGGQEFRRFSTASLRIVMQQVKLLLQDPDSGYTALLYPDSPSPRSTVSAARDFNGGFWPQNVLYLDNDPAIHADYVQVRFSLNTSAQLPGEVYLTGRFADWAADPRAAMAYNPETKHYESTLLLKQGLYDYTYLVRKPDGSLDERLMNGAFTESENYYTMLIYYKGPGDRSHRVVGVGHVNHGQ